MSWPCSVQVCRNCTLLQRNRDAHQYVLLVRVVAFVIRAVMVKVVSAGENLGLLIGDQILFGIGYAGLLYSSYTLVLDLYVFPANLIYLLKTYEYLCVEPRKRPADQPESRSITS